MALDKLVDSAQLDNNLTSVANAIRAKSGGTGQLAFPAGFVSEIGNISGGGGITPTGTKEITITENGTTTEDVTNYATAQITVNVPSGGGGSGALVGSGTFTPEANTTTLSVDVGGDFDLFIFWATSNPLSHSVRVSGGGVYDKTANLRRLFLSSNNSGSTWTNSALNTAWTPSAGTTMTVTTDNLIAGITYQWYAFRRT